MSGFYPERVEALLRDECDSLREQLDFLDKTLAELVDEFKRRNAEVVARRDFVRFKRDALIDALGAR